MSQWKMNSADFKHLLEEVQDYKCAITGLSLLPENVVISFKNPLSKGGKVALSNVCLVHESISKLTKEYTHAEIRVIARAIVHWEETRNEI